MLRRRDAGSACCLLTSRGHASTFIHSGTYLFDFREWEDGYG
jgi:hypothetical protein